MSDSLEDGLKLKSELIDELEQETGLFIFDRDYSVRVESDSEEWMNIETKSGEYVSIVGGEGMGADYRKQITTDIVENVIEFVEKKF